jgi:hypothetical protein
VLVRLATLLIAPAIAALGWAGIGLALGLPTALIVAGAILAGLGGVLTVAVCAMGTGQHQPVEHVEQERTRTVKAEPQKRFGRGEQRTRPGDRVEAGRPPDRAA